MPNPIGFSRGNELKFSRTFADLSLVVVSVQDLCDPSCCSLEEAIRVAKQRAVERQAYDLQLSQYLNELWRGSHVDPKIIERTLILLAEIAPPARLFGILRTAMAQYDPHIRSKSAVALARHVESVAWLSKLTTDDDPRVRANTIEALWGRNSPEIETMFFEALKDSHHRVAANAVYGLHLIDPKKHRLALEAFINHMQPRYRSAAAWVIGKIGDPGMMPLLKPLMFDKMPEVKHAAFRTLALLRAKDATVKEEVVPLREDAA